MPKKRRPCYSNVSEKKINDALKARGAQCTPGFGCRNWKAGKGRRIAHKAMESADLDDHDGER